MIRARGGLRNKESRRPDRPATGPLRTATEPADLRSKHKRVVRIRDRPVNLSCQSFHPAFCPRVPDGDETAGYNMDFGSRGRYVSFPCVSSPLSPLRSTTNPSVSAVDLSPDDVLTVSVAKRAACSRICAAADRQRERERGERSNGYGPTRPAIFFAIRCIFCAPGRHRTHLHPIRLRDPRNRNEQKGEQRPLVFGKVGISFGDNVSCLRRGFYPCARAVLLRLRLETETFFSSILEKEED